MVSSAYPANFTQDYGTSRFLGEETMGEFGPDIEGSDMELDLGWSEEEEMENPYVYDGPDWKIDPVGLAGV